MKFTETIDYSINDWYKRLRDAAPLLLGVAGILAAAWAIWLNLNIANAADPFLSTLPLAQSESQQEIEFDLPLYLANKSGDYIYRRADHITHIPHRSRTEVLRYTVQEGDAIFGIARKFGLQPETILWGNYEVLNDDPHLLRPGQELNILPVDGTYYKWHDGDNIDEVAYYFGVESLDIIEWIGNGLDPVDPAISPGTWLVVPGGRREFRQWLVPTIARGQAGVGSAFGPGGCTGDYSGGAIGTGGFIWPSANHYISGNDYWSGHLAIDIAAGLGESIWAADSGVVVFAGWSTVGYGNMIMIDHGNGWQTLYGHLSQVDVGCGESVSQGQHIGLAGSTGNSTGAHLHFETRSQGGYINPWYVLP